MTSPDRLPGCMACEANAGRLVPPGGVIHEDERWRLEHALSPVLLRGWLILKTQRHVEHVAELTQGEGSALGGLLQRASNAMRIGLGAERVYVCSFGELVHHVHFYLVPRYAGMPEDGVEVLSAMFSEPSPWACDDAAATEAADRVRVAMAASGQAAGTPSAFSDTK